MSWKSVASTLYGNPDPIKAVQNRIGPISQYSGKNTAAVKREMYGAGLSYELSTDVSVAFGGAGNDARQACARLDASAGDHSYLVAIFDAGGVLGLRLPQAHKPSVFGS